MDLVHLACRTIIYHIHLIIKEGLVAPLLLRYLNVSKTLLNLVLCSDNTRYCIEEQIIIKLSMV